MRPVPNRLRRHNKQVLKDGRRNEPFVLDVLVDACGNEDGDDGVVPAGNEHQRETQTDAEN